jgi:hypothetical protein
VSTILFASLFSEAISTGTREAISREQSIGSLPNMSTVLEETGVNAVFVEFINSPYISF